LSGVLKNALDWLVGSGELYEKRVAVLCASPRPTGGVFGREALERTLKAQGAVLVASATVGVVAADKSADELHDPEAVAVIRAAIDALRAVPVEPAHGLDVEGVGEGVYQGDG